MPAVAETWINSLIFSFYSHIREILTLIMFDVTMVVGRYPETLKNMRNRH